MMYNIFHGYDYRIINYVCNFFKNIFEYIQKHNLKVSKCHKIGCSNILFTCLKNKKEIDCLPEYPTQSNPKVFGLGWFELGVKKKPKNSNQPNPRLFN